MAKKKTDEKLNEEKPRVHKDLDGFDIKINSFGEIQMSYDIEKINQFSYLIKKHTVIVLDNAKVHQSKSFIAMKNIWAKRNLFIFYLPPYSPHLNIIERLWKEMKARWINEKDYQTSDHLFFATHLVLNQIGKSLNLNFKKV
jgi:transposase